MNGEEDEAHERRKMKYKGSVGHERKASKLGTRVGDQWKLNADVLNADVSFLHLSITIGQIQRKLSSGNSSLVSFLAVNSPLPHT